MVQAVKPAKPDNLSSFPRTEILDERKPIPAGHPFMFALFNFVYHQHPKHYWLSITMSSLHKGTNKYVYKVRIQFRKVPKVVVIVDTIWMS